MQIERINVKLCCGGSGFSLKLNPPLHKDMIPLFVMNNFSAPAAFTKSGIFYVENQDLIAHGSFGSDILSIRCKSKVNCQQSIAIIEGLLTKMEYER